jgi:hypothetical protein
MEALAEALDGARSKALAIQMRTNRVPDVVELHGSWAKSPVNTEDFGATPGRELRELLEFDPQPSDP